jgi:hypothetical protein
MRQCSSTRLTVGLEGPWVGRNERAVASAPDGEAHDIAAAVVVLDEGPDDNWVRAFSGLHVRTVQGGCDLEDLHAYHGKRRLVIGVCGPRTVFAHPRAADVPAVSETGLKLNRLAGDELDQQMDGERHLRKRLATHRQGGSSRQTGQVPMLPRPRCRSGALSGTGSS